MSFAGIQIEYRYLAVLDIIQLFVLCISHGTFGSMGHGR
jgi:hypothetical protein